MTSEEMLAALRGVREAMVEDFTGPDGKPTDELVQLDAVIAALNDPPLAEVETEALCRPDGKATIDTDYDLPPMDYEYLPVIITIRKGANKGQK